MGLWGIEPSAFQQILIMSDRTVLKRDKYSKMEACDSMFREAWDLQKNMVKNEECVLEKENLPSNVKPKGRETVELSWALWNVRLHVYIIVHVPTVPLSWWQKIMHSIELICLFVCWQAFECYLFPNQVTGLWVVLLSYRLHRREWYRL